MPKILIVDDEPDILDIITDRIKSILGSGCEVVTAGDGKAAIEDLIKHGKFDLLITDNKMPKVMGHDVINALFNGTRYEHLIPIMVITGDPPSVKLPSDPSVKSLVRILAKPVNDEEFEKCLHELLAMAPRT